MGAIRMTGMRGLRRAIGGGAVVISGGLLSVSCDSDSTNASSDGGAGTGGVAKDSGPESGGTTPKGGGGSGGHAAGGTGATTSGGASSGGSNGGADAMTSGGTGSGGTETGGVPLDGGEAGSDAPLSDSGAEAGKDSSVFDSGADATLPRCPAPFADGDVWGKTYDFYASFFPLVVGPSTRLYSGFYRGYAFSDDDGQTWRVKDLSALIPAQKPRPYPAVSADGSSVWLYLKGVGTLVSRDAGRSFAAVNALS